MPFKPKPSSNLPATVGGATVEAQPRRRSRLLGGIPPRAVGEAVLVAAVLAVAAFWQGDVISERMGMYLDTAKAWPVDGVFAVLAAVALALTKKLKGIHKIRFVVPLAVYGGSAIYSARERAGLSVG